ncbi:MAG: hypothetical protein EAX86_12050 [Candidatus Heimdallarchaeota archaeon]|nr:hypothetical protein [Candidatus Heimdallarchaeota archaeon]
MSKKEIGSKLRRKISPLILAPGVTDLRIQKLVHFIQENENDGKIFLLNRSKEVLFFKSDRYFLPSIQFLRDHQETEFPSVSVDQGAVRHVLNGADIFSQGITSINKQFDKDSYVIVRNPQNAIIAIGKSLLTSEEILEAKGKALLNVHYLGDAIWRCEV